ncbi:MAG: hypothetical protein JWL91_2613 [Sphingomonas bacterium]|nr:ATP-binding protein [Sphingomonas bacterium]MDB5690737.1 hypothetical protein [Sphingomonas bacterium]
MRLVGRHVGGLLLIAAPVAASSSVGAPPLAFVAATPSTPIVILSLLLTGAAVSIVALLVRLARVRRECDRLVSADAAMQRALLSRGEFLATTSHEIRTPLNGILGMTQVLLADSLLDKTVRDRIGVVHGAGETMKALVDDILDIAKIEAGGLTIERVPLDIRQLIDDAQRLWHVETERKGLRLDVDLSDCPTRIEGDPVRLRQIIANLMSNAIKFTDSGSVALSARAEGMPGSERLVIRVADTGIGVPTPQQDLIFEKYRQADGSITRRFGGTGLGLAICRSLAKAMGGVIAIDSVPGQGSTFTVSLPLIRAAAPAGAVEPREAPAGATRLSEARLLVVEPNPLTRRVIVKMLEGAAEAVETAASPAEAEERLARGGIDHVVAEFDCIGVNDPGCQEKVNCVCDLASASGSRMTLLFAPGREAAVAAFAAKRPGIHMLAKPIAAPALVAELRRLYSEEGASHSRPARPLRALIASVGK